MNRTFYKLGVLFTIVIGIFVSDGFSQEPTRVGTTAANFLEVGYGNAGVAMGDAVVSQAHDLSSVYWNPAAPAYMTKNEAYFMYQPWIADIKTTFAAVGIVIPTVGTLSLNIISMNYGDMPVTTMDMQEGTGELFSANDVAMSISFARSLTTWFSFGATAKYVTSNIWHSKASAMATDLGVIINTDFFSPTGRRADGMNIGMSISNYGTRMKFDGMDLMNPIDILPDEAGNFRDVPGQFTTSEWELPLIFRIGVSLTPIVTDQHKLILAVDALHPNNNTESVNVGAQYSLTAAGFGVFYLRAGYKALFMKNTEFGPSLGVGLESFLLFNTGLRVEYAYRGVGVLGNINSLSVGFMF